MANLSEKTNPYYKSTIVALNGNFTAGSLKIERIGEVVYISSDQKLTHSSSSAPASSSALIPTWARPSATQDDQGSRNACGCDPSEDIIVQAWISANGVFQTSYALISTGASSSRVDSGFPVNLSYRIG